MTERSRQARVGGWRSPPSRMDTAGTTANVGSTSYRKAALNGHHFKYGIKSTSDCDMRFGFEAVLCIVNWNRLRFLCRPRRHTLGGLGTTRVGGGETQTELGRPSSVGLRSDKRLGSATWTGLRAELYVRPQLKQVKSKIKVSRFWAGVLDRTPPVHVALPAQKQDSSILLLT